MDMTGAGDGFLGSSLRYLVKAGSDMRHDASSCVRRQNMLTVQATLALCSGRRPLVATGPDHEDVSIFPGSAQAYPL